MKRPSLWLSSLFLFTACGGLAACGGHAKLPEGVSTSAVSAACHHEQADGESEVFVLRDASGKPLRLEITASRKYPDAANMFFDLDGRYLGNDTSHEFPRDDKALYEKEKARVDGLLGGAVRGNPAAVARCKDL
jgi:hypothetical protein